MTPSTVGHLGVGLLRAWSDNRLLLDCFSFLSGCFLRLFVCDLNLAYVFTQSQSKVVSECDAAHILSFELSNVSRQNSGLEVTLA